MLNLIKKLLLEKVNDIECGNSNLTEEEALQVVGVLNSLSRKDEGMSRTQAAKYLRCSLSKFDRKVKSGELPKGKKVLGFTELRWYEKDLINYIQEYGNKEKHKNSNI